jgi:putative transposase
LPSDIIAFVVFCRLRCRLTLRDLSEIMLWRGFTISHESIRRWEAKLLLVMGEALRKRRHGIGRSSGQSWYADETYLKVHGRLYRAIDRDGHLIDTMLSATRDVKAARRFFRSARSVAGFVPDRRAQFLPTRDPLDIGPQRPSQDERLPEQSTRTRPSREQRTHPMYARIQGA